MAVRRALVLDNGRIKQMANGDTPFGAGGGGSVVIEAVTVDFGADGALSKTFDVSVTGATVGQKVLASVSLDMPAGVDEDELEMDMITVAGRVSAADTVRLIAASVSGTAVSGQRTINLTVG
jgi:hypothetical protein